MLYSNNGFTHDYNAKDNTKSNWCTAYFHCGPCPNKMTSEFNCLIQSAIKYKKVIRINVDATGLEVVCCGLRTDLYTTDIYK